MRGATITWGGGEHLFSLPIGHLIAVQDACEAGPQEVLLRLSSGRWLVQDVQAVLRHGLQGGGMEKAEAARLVRETIDSAGIMSLVSIAYRVMAAALTGYKDDPVGEDEGVSPSQGDGSSAGSMEPEPSPVSPQEMSTE